MTRKKLELTRLPHELLLPRARDWEYGTPKAEIEPLIDFWYDPLLSLRYIKGDRNREESGVLTERIGWSITPGETRRIA